MSDKTASGTKIAKLRVQVIIPTYNERENIGKVLAALDDIVRSSPFEWHVLVVDDNSPDGTGEEVKAISLRKEYLQLLSRKGKMGLGTAYLDTFRFVIPRIDPDIIVQMDSDLSHPVRLLPEMISCIIHGSDIVIASRYVPGGGSTDWGWSRKLTSKGANWLARSILGIETSDATSGYRALNRNAAKVLLQAKPQNKGYGYQVESIYLGSKFGLKIEEIPFTFEKRESGSTKLSMLEILSFLRMLLRLKFRHIQR